MTSLSQRSIPCLLTACLVLTATGCSTDHSTGYVKISGSTMGTTYSVIVKTDKAQASRLRTSIEAELKTINQLMSTYIPDSEINQFNNLADGSCFSFSDQTWFVLQAAKKVHNDTHGAFDITMGPLISRWGFNVEEYAQRVPSREEVLQLLSYTGTDKLSYDNAQQCISKTVPEVTVNLSAIAKGYAVDRLAQITLDFGVSDFLTEIGGETKASGQNPDGVAWRIAIEDPASRVRQQAKLVQLNDSSIATSGDYRIYFTHDGKRFSHTIDPETGYPITHSLASVSVVHPSNMMADAYATAFSVMGTEKAHKFATENSVPLFTISRDGSAMRSQANLAFKSTVIEQ